jgi:hypothetical protein
MVYLLFDGMLLFFGKRGQTDGFPAAEQIDPPAGIYRKEWVEQLFQGVFRIPAKSRFGYLDELGGKEHDVAVVQFVMVC